ncbi:hypothetical protein C1878_00025 [Gordonibacter sp. 28C]|uniref:DUF3846 domain-containing protein n=1 Tax=Gordonibacter sp. 28C TaxID=2078569 RepID=UPI000DF740F8|nr:DUF3846 domain-containing protein [Gordonibacter sp. 28C]RDB64296.1 hypothetical protein C1878_00025 [Gordonibacter sp. 28C]
MKPTLNVMIAPVGRAPYDKTLAADEHGGFLRALQSCVGGHIEPMDYLFDDAPAVYCNAEGKIGSSLFEANRAVYATREMAEAGYASPSDPDRAVVEGELFDVVFGDMVCVGFDAETGESRDVTEAECARVVERFASPDSIGSGRREVLRILLGGESR